MSYHKKLIEVALPLEAINKEAAREKSIRHGHPSTLHLWWARRPLAACRAVLFAQMVDDPSSHPELFPTEAEQNQERERLFDIIRELVLWENINNEKVLERARAEIRRYAPPEGLPPVLDPFAGGGSIPLEAQRLGLEAHASDLNPVAVLINKALIEIPPKFANMPPVNPESRRQKRTVEVWRGAQGLAEDVRYYGQWMRDEAEKRIGHLYPKVTITEAMLSERPDLRAQGLQAGEELTVIAWLWTRTVASPNPAASGAHVPLVRSFELSKKKGRRAWVEPVVNREKMTYHFEVQTGKGKVNRGTIERKGGVCLLTGAPIPFDYIRDEGKAGRMSERLMAIVAEGPSGRVYFEPLPQHEQTATSANPQNLPNTDLPEQALGFRVQLYGMTKHKDLFTSRQLVALTTFGDLLQDVNDQVWHDATITEKQINDHLSFDKGGTESTTYTDAIVTYLAFAIDKGANLWSSISSWMNDRGAMRETFARQTVSMIWDFAEANPFSNSGGNLAMFVKRVADTLEFVPCEKYGFAEQSDATTAGSALPPVVISTDPPYYDNIGYADLSDFFYIWLRRSLANRFSSLFNTLLVPKTQELIANFYRFNGDKEKATKYFENGLRKVFEHVSEIVHPDYPMTVYYAFKQSEVVVSGEKNNTVSVASTGWETILEGLIQAGFSITGTWPIRTEGTGRIRGIGSNALASSIVLVCRPRPKTISTATRRDFLNSLKRELPFSLKELQHGNVAPVDLAQASIGPGMAIFSRYSKVIEADGSPMRVRTALALINQALDEYLSEQEGEYDPDTRWALAWFEQFGFKEGAFGDAETLSKAKNTSVGGMVQAGFLEAGGGKVRLLRREELNPDWDPASDQRLTVWEVTQYLIRTMEDKGETAAADLLTQVGPLGEAARDLAYRLYQICERKGWAQEALPYNGLVVAWSDVGRLAIEAQRERPVQRGFDF